MFSVLYVDDDPTLLEVTQLILERSGEFKVDLATSAADALKVPGLLLYDAIVSDYLMADMDGIALLKEIRSRSADIPFIIFTGRGREEVVIEAINNGADFYLQKGKDPTTQFTELKQRIRQAAERKRAKEALMESAEQYRLLAENSPEMVYVVDADGQVRYLNSVAARQFNAPPDSITGKYLSEIFPAAVSEQHLGILRQIISSKQSVHREILEETPSGSRWIDVNLAPIIGPAGTVSGVLGISNDITDRKHAEDALKETNKKLILLSSITRHDVLNKLTALQGFIELSRECFSGDETFRSFAEKELVAVSEIQRIISFTKEYEEIGVRSHEWQDIRDVLRKAAGWLDWNGVDLRIQVFGYMVYADPLLEKVFYNILDNSLRHGQSVTSIDISATETGSGLVIVCQDNGTGIPATEKERIFGRGYGRHSGFGLFLAREILGITGISIRETGEPGAGARFEILAPRGVYRAAG
jgi:PAS domain S-box-containing protein